VFLGLSKEMISLQNATRVSSIFGISIFRDTHFNIIVSTFVSGSEELG